MNFRMRGTLVIAAAIVLFASDVSGRAKTDIVVLVNGDHLTGEIKRLERGKLSLSTDAMSTVAIEWADVDSLSSQYYFEIEDWDGYKYYGTPILTGGSDFRVIHLNAIIALKRDQVVRITPIEKSFWQRIEGSVSLGVTYTKGSQIGKLDAAFNARYRVEKNLVELKATTNTTTQAEQHAVTRSEASLTYQRLFQRKLYSDVSSVLFRNDELGIASRITVATGVGANVVQTNWSLLQNLLGVSVNREWSTDPTTAPTTNVEGVVKATYSLFKYNTPKTDLTTDASLLPRLPKFERWRFEFDTSYSQELVKDFMLVLTLYYSYDSRPPGEGARKSDWGMTTSFAYKF